MLKVLNSIETDTVHSSVHSSDGTTTHHADSVTTTSTNAATPQIRKSITSGRVLLVSTSFEEFSHITSQSEEDMGQILEDSHYSLGLGYLQGWLESKGCEAMSLFLNNNSLKYSMKKLISTIDEWDPNIVGFQVMTQNRVSTYRAIEYIHEHYPSIHIILGGIHTTALYEQLIKKYPYIITVLGEGEITLEETVDTLMAGGDLTTVPGLALFKDGQVIKTANRALIENLDVLPFPKHELFMHTGREIGCILTSRGCPFKCSFCVLEAVSRRLNRTRSIKNVMDEVEYMINAFPWMKIVWIHDDTFFLNNERVIEFCDEAIRRGVNKKIQFVASGRMKPISERLVQKLEDANFREVLLGLETGNEMLLKSSHKAITRNDVLNAFGLFSKRKITVSTFLIVGLPGETMETIVDTANFVQQLQKIKYVYFYNASVLTIYPGTEVCRIAMEKGQITEDFWLTDEPTPLFTVEHTPEELFKMKKVLLDRVSMNKIITPKGFMHQYHIIPYMTKFLWNKRHHIIPAATNIIRDKLQRHSRFFRYKHEATTHKTEATRYKSEAVC